MVGAMNPRAIACMEDGLIRQVDWLLDQMSEQVDLIKSFAGAIPLEVIGNLFNMPHEERGPLQDWSLAILGALEPTLSQQQLDDGNRAVSEFKTYLKDLVFRRAKNPCDPETDVLTRLMQSEQGQLSEVELLQNCIFILNAGHETTTNLIGNALALLDADPTSKDALIVNPGLLNTAVDEFLRMESPNQFGNRLTTEDISLHGTDIPAGTDLHLCIGAANRDAERFEKPDTLQLDRRPNKHLAFAGGAHTCVGLSLARMEGRIALGRFLDRFPNYALMEGAKRGNRIRPDNTLVIMAGFNNTANKPRDTNAIRAHMHRNRLAIGAADCCPHGFGIFSAKVKNMANLNTAQRHKVICRHRTVFGIMHVISARIEADKFINKRL